MSDWITWDGGEMPVAARVKVEVRMRDMRRTYRRMAHSFDWRHVSDATDIIAYRVEAAPRPLSEGSEIAPEHASDG